MGSKDITQQLVNDLKVVLERAEELLETTSDASGESLKAARRKLSKAVKSLGKEWSLLSERAADAARASGRMVKEHPYESAGGGLVLLAVVVGALWLWKRSR